MVAIRNVTVRDFVTRFQQSLSFVSSTLGRVKKLVDSRQLQGLFLTPGERQVLAGLKNQYPEMSDAIDLLLAKQPLFPEHLVNGDGIIAGGNVGEITGPDFKAHVSELPNTGGRTPESLVAREGVFGIFCGVNSNAHIAASVAAQSFAWQMEHGRDFGNLLSQISSAMGAYNEAFALNDLPALEVSGSCIWIERDQVQRFKTAGFDAFSFIRPNGQSTDTGFDRLIKGDVVVLTTEAARRQRPEATANDLETIVRDHLKRIENADAAKIYQNLTESPQFRGVPGTLVVYHHPKTFDVPAVVSAPAPEVPAARTAIFASMPPVEQPASLAATHDDILEIIFLDSVEAHLLPSERDKIAAAENRATLAEATAASYQQRYDALINEASDFRIARDQMAEERDRAVTEIQSLRAEIARLTAQAGQQAQTIIQEPATAAIEPKVITEMRTNVTRLLSQYAAIEAVLENLSTEAAAFSDEIAISNERLSQITIPTIRGIYQDVIASLGQNIESHKTKQAEQRQQLADTATLITALAREIERATGSNEQRYQELKTLLATTVAQQGEAVRQQATAVREQERLKGEMESAGTRARELINLRDRLNFVAPQTLVETELPPSARPTQPAPAEEAAARQLPAAATNWAEEVKVAYQAGNGEELASLANRSIPGAFAAWELLMAEQESAKI